MKKTWGELIHEWIDEKPSRRSVAQLAEAADVSKSKIYDLIHGESASLDVACKLSRVLPPREIFHILAREHPLFLEFFLRCCNEYREENSSSNKE